MTEEEFNKMMQELREEEEKEFDALEEFLRRTIKPK